MHPSYSVIFFTTATGAGYGLLACLGVSAGFGLIEPGFWFRFVSLGLALFLISAGLLSSAAHLGRPERAWRAFSQWRSSWLSREGVASVATFIPAGLFGQPSLPAHLLALALTTIGWAWKVATWRHNDALGMGTTLNSATGLEGGVVRSIEWPHTEENYLLKEMGFRIARKHSARLRLNVQVLAFGLPLLLLAAAVGLSATPWLSAGLSLIAAVSQLAGMLVERWLFFAEAKHVVTLYYGR